jgi:voltage-gated potassium channel
MTNGFPQLANPDTGEGKTILRSVLALAVVVAAGTYGFMLVEPGWGVWKSFFFTLITITTVGYGDQGLSESGQRFAAILLLVGIATATYCLSSIVTITVQYQKTWKRRMQQRIKRLQGHFVICGYGRIGATVCQEFVTAGVPFVVIEKHEAAHQAALESGHLAIHGNADEDHVLRQAGMERARGVICVINSDAENVFIALSAREINPTAFVAARADAEVAVRRLERAGASLVISPYTTAGMTIANTILSSTETDVMDGTDPGNLDAMLRAAGALETPCEDRVAAQ